MASVMRLTPREAELLPQLDRDPFTEFAKRDRYGRPEIDGTSYRRPSTVAKALDNASGLVQWKAKTVAFGALQSPFVLDQLRAVSPEDRYAVKGLVEQLADAGGGSEAANYGALVHALLEVDDNPEQFRWPYDTDLWAEVAESPHFAEIRSNYRELMTQLNLTFDPAYVEVPLISDALLLAGTCDRIVTLPNGTARVFDLKTKEGRLFPDKMLGWLTQLHVYAQASCIYDPQTNERHPLPESFDRDIGYICVVDRATAEVELLEFDLRPGARFLELAAEVEDARKNSGQYATKITEPFRERNDFDVIAGRIEVLKTQDGFGLEKLMQRWQAAGLPKPSELGPEHWPLALDITDAVLAEESISNLTLDEVLQRLAELPEDLRNGAEAHGKWVDRSVWEDDSREAAQLQADVDVRIAEKAFEARKRTVHAAWLRVPAAGRAPFRDWLAEELKIDVAEPKGWTKRCVRTIDALSRAVEANWLNPDGGIVDADAVLSAVQKKYGKTAKGPANEAFAEAAKWLGVPRPKSYTAGVANAAVVAYALCADDGTV